MPLFPLFKKKDFFSAEEKKQIVECIRSAERQTSGEIRVFVESKNPFVDPIDRAAEIFFKFKMRDTEHRNAVLLYIATKDKELALFADQGIYERTGAEYWNSSVQNMIASFTKENITNGLEQCILQIGQTLKEKFPYEATTDKNELPDEIIFGK
ncbi:TPM domain-containing protein [Ferruginibacter sp. SUN002]|uniref:TPM domain-containing protein n=1 Tax=Ferruginibacter sp. SUN002 TaxID=2937789 RepID=UPI003D35DD7C